VRKTLAKVTLWAMGGVSAPLLGSGVRENCGGEPAMLEMSLWLHALCRRTHAPLGVRQDRMP
jgi:hypothetical protein